MITTIHIKNIGIIEDITIDFNQGLNILTGETGAGKTLIIDSLGILAGGRFSKEMIRKGEEYSYVEACLFLPNHENAIEGNIIVSREICTNGRNMCKINGRMVTVNELKEFMKPIIDIHGQQDNQVILDKNSHIGYLDSFIGEEIETLKEEYRKQYNQYCEINRLLAENYGDETEKERKLDLLKYQLKEIQVAGLKMGEEEELEEKHRKMMHAEKVMQNLAEANGALSNQTIDSVNIAIRALEKIEEIDSSYAEKLVNLKNIYYEVQELTRDISSMQEEDEWDVREQEAVEERLDTLFSLKRKYGNSIEAVMEYAEKLEKQIEEIENMDEINQKRRKELVEIEKTLQQLGNNMHEVREKYAKKLSRLVNQELSDLEMKQAQFTVGIKKKSQYQKNGIDEVEFYICTNVGEEAKPLIKIASGGEMSRIMLAIKSVLAEIDRVPVLIFDEIDTGISGIAANAVGQKMKRIAKYHQVLCITHLANIAAKGDYNYYISKKVKENHTVTQIEQLNEERTLQEIARIASGDVSKISIEHAQALRKAV